MKRLIPVFILSLLVVSTYGQSTVLKADMQHDQRDYALAISTYEKAFSDDPANEDIPAKIARCYVQLQDYLSASQWYERIADNENVNPQYVLEYANVLKSLRLYAKARFYYQKVSTSDPVLGDYFTYGCDIAKVEMNGEPYYEISTTSVNSRSAEFAPVLYNDDLIFSSFRSDLPVAQVRKSKNGKTLNQKQSVFVAGKRGAKDVAALNIGVAGNEVISHVRYSDDGKFVAFQKSDLRDGQRLYDDRPGKISLYVGKVGSNGEWTEIKPFEHNGNDFSTGYPSFSPDGSVLYFASTRHGGLGGWDIWVSFRSLQGWTTPQNLGEVINTAGNELSPFYSDHKLFFSSDWHPGIGGFDVFKAHSVEGIWTNVRSMGYPLNSPKDDIDFVWDPIQSVGYFASNRIGTTGAYDIYSCVPKYEEVLMTVMDQEGSMPVEGAMIKFVNGGGAPVTTDKNGQVYIHQHFSHSTSIVIKHNDYRDLSMTIRTPGEGPAKYEVFIDKSLEVGSEKVVASNEAANTDMVKSKNKSVQPTTTAQAKQSAPEKEVITTRKTVVVGNPEATSGTVSDSEGNSREIVSNKPAARQETKQETKEPVVVIPEHQPKPNVGMYAVQIAAVGKSTSLDQYSNLSTIGKVMQYPENGMYKIRVGYYKDETTAKHALSSIKKSGYPDAFVVTAKPNETFEEKVEEESDLTYYVRLGTYSKPEYFDETKVSHLGEVSREKSGTFTIMLLGEFTSLKEAQSARAESAKAGFKDAYIVDQELRKIK